MRSPDRRHDRVMRFVSGGVGYAIWYSTYVEMLWGESGEERKRCEAAEGAFECAPLPCKCDEARRAGNGQTGRPRAPSRTKQRPATHRRDATALGQLKTRAINHLAISPETTII